MDVTADLETAVSASPGVMVLESTPGLLIMAPGEKVSFDVRMRKSITALGRQMTITLQPERKDV